MNMPEFLKNVLVASYAAHPERGDRVVVAQASDAHGFGHFDIYRVFEDKEPVRIDTQNFIETARKSAECAAARAMKKGQMEIDKREAERRALEKKIEAQPTWGLF
ncbi:hypothetical protein GCM10011316_21700 [Roseibium aquae]|uniref:Uncharacterized protein n=1 Tax=Roseibium aquae TaxID=1323746 RepID=A0A916TMK5_9HYPH|nr:hypothetical protein [Roseibium aquae]GGB49233.1 hypothetical protein GCM10011316_21700 [Roseibium aquae]